MEPIIESTRFGSMTLVEDGERIEYDHDILIRLDGKVHKRNKKLSKRVYGTSHTISEAEAEHIYQQGVEKLLIGTGQFGLVQLSDEADRFFQGRGVATELRPTPEAMQLWNEMQGRVIALFHVTC